MAHIVILTHEYDDYAERPYLLRDLSPHWQAAGHTVQVVEGLSDWPDAELAILHVDHSLVPHAYARACQRYPRVINGAALDIRKRHVSGIVLERDSQWSGPVIVKTNLNRGGMPEMRYYRMLQQAGRPGAHPPRDMVFSKDPYEILPDKTAVNPTFWNQPGIVIEPFLPERDARGYWVRTWLFLGSQERCSRFLGSDPLLKAANILAREASEVPPELRAERERLGFDFGKFDFVVHEGRGVLLDANRTPYAPPASIRPDLAEANARLATGITQWLGGA